MIDTPAPNDKKLPAMNSTSGAVMDKLSKASVPADEIRIFESAEMLPPMSEKSPEQVSDKAPEKLDVWEPAH
ncbi:MAG: hypothetical protein BWK72_20235 [Rhodoferax ferrireducens]|uniref:Uncharacterized protein n=1 Tax=Rhodoferax ferrireducens TaxID=192843 RepID=A0A1W9KNW2_9BURK|nr:MAG: hypothetical protein BWK72_20235 [Rhodoferax ferrireducens]